MSFRYIIVIWLSLFIATGSKVYAGDIVTPGFIVGTKQPPEVLQHIDLKALVTEFLDPVDTGFSPDSVIRASRLRAARLSSVRRLPI